MIRPRPLNSQVALGLLLLLAGFGYFSASTIFAPASSTAGQAVQPWPDGAEYLDAAVSLVREGSYTIHIAGEEHPPRYPFGHSLWIAGVMLLGADVDEAPHLANTLAGALLLSFIAAVFWRQGLRIEAGLAVLLLATLPAFVILCRSPMSEVTSTLIAVAAVSSLYGYSRDGTQRLGLVGAFLLGFGFCFRTSGVLLAVFVPAAVLARFLPWKTAKIQNAARDTVLLGVCFALGLLPAMAYNGMEFGQPLASGYNYWVPFWNASNAFDDAFLGPNLTYYWQELTEAETEFTTATTYGHSQGSYLNPAFLLLALLAFGLLRHNRHLHWFVLAALSYQAVLMFYFFKDARLAFPVMALTVMFIAQGLGTLRQGSRWRGLQLALVLPLILATVIGWPGRQGSAESLTLLRETRAPAPAYTAVESFLRLEVPQPGLVLTDMAPPYVHARMPEGTTVAPVDHDHLYRHNPEVFIYKDRQRDQLLQDALTAQQDIWVLFGRQDIFAIAEKVAPPEGFAWEIVRASGMVGGIARLVRVAPKSHP